MPLWGTSYKLALPRPDRCVAAAPVSTGYIGWLFLQLGHVQPHTGTWKMPFLKGRLLPPAPDTALRRRDQSSLGWGENSPTRGAQRGLNITTTHWTQNTTISPAGSSTGPPSLRSNLMHPQPDTRPQTWEVPVHVAIICFNMKL